MAALKLYAVGQVMFLCPFLIRGVRAWRAERRFWRENDRATRGVAELVSRSVAG